MNLASFIWTGLKILNGCSELPRGECCLGDLLNLNLSFGLARLVVGPLGILLIDGVCNKIICLCKANLTSGFLGETLTSIGGFLGDVILTSKGFLIGDGDGD